MRCGRDRSGVTSATHVFEVLKMKIVEYWSVFWLLRGESGVFSTGVNLLNVPKYWPVSYHIIAQLYRKRKNFDMVDNHVNI